MEVLIGLGFVIAIVVVVYNLSGDGGPGPGENIGTATGLPERRITSDHFEIVRRSSARRVLRQINDPAASNDKDSSHRVDSSRNRK